MPGPDKRNLVKLTSRVVRSGLAATLALSLNAPALHAQESQPRNGPSLIRDSEIEAILRADAAPIFRAAGLQSDNVHIYLVNDRELNAFVAGGQNLFLNTGLIMKTKTPNELMGVIAHETGHIADGHLARNDEGSRAAMATQLVTMGLGMVAAFAGGDPGAAAALVYSAEEFGALQYFTFTRVQEASADQAGARFLETAGLSGKGLVDFFNNFKYEEVFANAKRDKFFQSHPLTAVRIDALKSRVEAAPHYGVVDTPEAIAQHAIMIAKLKAFINYPVETYRDYPETDTSFPARYARAIAHYKDLEPDKAVELLDALAVDYPTDPYIFEFKGQVLFEAGRSVEAEPALRKAVQLAPDQSLLRMALGQTLLANGNKAEGNIKEAITNLQRTVALEHDNALAWKLMAEAYERDGNPAMARLASAEEKFVEGQMGDARSFGYRARELLAEGTPEYRRASDIINAAEVTALQRRGRGG